MALNLQLNKGRLYLKTYLYKNPEHTVETSKKYFKVVKVSLFVVPVTRFFIFLFLYSPRMENAASASDSHLASSGFSSQ